ncbi:uncharacterized protein C8Q71DRAFT_910143 [Rhodofomes roseus]|uniref:Transcriptional regulator n=1 Tax=Rhodofomes roseus TaxID=34475 RepID=A0ABQ8K7I3_9APHY|nr:uncharacterized protein C8Q71DRAFT_910143 [Rhodofomes roseus]KAH9832648.1 hypothetical protein C8Q71DRAFT_910143 [Rhodofomes roseus]
MKMSEVDVDEVKRVTRDIIKQAKEDGTLDSGEWTPGKVRREVERRLSLETETLAAKEYKSVVKQTIDAAIEGGNNEHEEETPEPEPAKKNKPTKTTKTAKERNKEPKKKATEKSAPAKKSRKAETPKRSASVVPSSDDEGGATSSAKPVSEAPKRKSKKAAVPDEEYEAESPEPPKKRQKSTAEVADVEMQDAGATSNVDPEASPSAADTKQDSVPSYDLPVTVADSGYKSESEMSVLIDEPPKRGRKKGKDADSKKSAKEPKARKSRQPAKELSKDEETIKRLKSFVVACGVRKQWAREFKDIDRPSDQIRRLKQILSDLGMTGRMSLEQAKAIREKREFAQELEDVKNFEKTVVAGARASRSKKAQAPEEVPEDESDEDMAEKPKRPRATARQSIMAFLQDQSDDE